jgi:hypothetical protein
LTNHPAARQRLQLQHLLDSPRWAVLVIALGWSLAGCGGSAKSPDGSATGTGGKSDGGPTDTAGASGGHAGTAGAGTTGAGGTSGASGTVGSLGGVGGAGFADIGKACASTANCASGLTCLTAAGNVFLGTEGPANGYCSRPCGADADCGGVGICLRVSADSAATEVDYCFQSCTFGGTTSKCHDRNDVGCLTIDATTTPTTDICYPLCSQDSDCPTGRHCDLAYSFCRDAAPTGDPLGTHCVSNPDSGTSNCAGGCLPVGSAAGGTTAVANFCSMLCVVGNLDACNWVAAGSSLKTGGSHGVCALSSSTAQPGDIGFCTQECDVATDCSDQTDAAGLTCDTSLMSTIGHGLCSWG